MGTPAKGPSGMHQIETAEVRRIQGGGASLSSTLSCSAISRVERRSRALCLSRSGYAKRSLLVSDDPGLRSMGPGSHIIGQAGTGVRRLALLMVLIPSDRLWVQAAAQFPGLCAGYRRVCHGLLSFWAA